MKKYLYTILFISAGLLTSCVDDTAPEDAYGESPNIAGFVNAAQSLSAVADGNVYDYGITMTVKGPSLDGLPDQITATISVDAANSSAVEGIHFTLASTNVTLDKSNNFIGSLPLSIITEGVDAPNQFVLVLDVTSVDGGSAVVANSSQIALTFVYQCWADLSGTYDVSNDFCGPVFEAVIVQNPDGSWNLSSADGGWLSTCTGNAGLWNPGNMVELCGEILPSGDLEFGTAGGYGIGDITGGTWDPDSGNGLLILENQDVFFNGGPYFWVSTYTRQ